MSTLIRLTRHPVEATVVLAHVPPDWSTTMGRFAPARFAAEHRAYLIHRELVGSFATFVRVEGGRLVDESRATPAGPTVSGSRVAGPECASCAQPAAAGAKLKVCPACGERWAPVVHQAATIGATRTACPACGHKQAGRFPHCGRCGQPMAYTAGAVRPPAVAVQRNHLDDPQPLAEVIAEHAPEVPAHVDTTTGELVDEDRACSRCFRPTPASLLDDTGRCPRCAEGA